MLLGARQTDKTPLAGAIYIKGEHLRSPRRDTPGSAPRTVCQPRGRRQWTPGEASHGLELTGCSRERWQIWIGTKSEKKSATESRPPGKRSKMGGSLWTSGTARCWLAACCMLELTRCGAFLGVGHAGSKYGLARPGFSPQDLRARDREPAAWPQQLPGVHALHRRHVLARCADRHSKAPEVPSKGAAGAGDERALQAVGREQRPEDSQEEAAAERRALEQKVRALEKELAAARDTAGAQGGDAEKTVLRGQVRTQRKRGLQAPAGFLGPEALDDERDYRDWEGSRSIFRQRYSQTKLGADFWNSEQMYDWSNAQAPSSMHACTHARTCTPHTPKPYVGGTPPPKNTPIQEGARKGRGRPRRGEQTRWSAKRARPGAT